MAAMTRFSTIAAVLAVIAHAVPQHNVPPSALVADDACGTEPESGDCSLSFRQLRGEMNMAAVKAHDGAHNDLGEAAQAQTATDKGDGGVGEPPSADGGSETAEEKPSWAKGCGNCMQGIDQNDMEAMGDTLEAEGDLGVASSGYKPLHQSLMLPSKAPVKTFYVYRAASDTSYPPQNVNVANLAGVMWYLHHEVVYMTPRKFDIVRILRFKIQTRATTPLFEKGMNFGIRYAFDHGMCTGPWTCDEQFAKYGYFVGCNKFEDKFPFPDKNTYYAGAIWYSLPGQCSSKTFVTQDPTCKWSEPGGSCSGTPTGTGDCTYSFEPAGEININELVGIPDYNTFVMTGKREFSYATDRGVGFDWWDGQKDVAKNKWRVEQASKLFAKKYPDTPTDEQLHNPPCDFNFDDFFEHQTPTAAPLQHSGENCWAACGNRPGFCPFCGSGYACCQWGMPGDAPECSTVKQWPTYFWPTCVTPR